MDRDQAAEKFEELSVDDFYVEYNCCTGCGVPVMVAPDLIGYVEPDGGKFYHCYWKKQPETAAEMQQVFAIFDGQELGCHRYRGRNPEIQQRIGRESCDDPVIRYHSSPVETEQLSFQPVEDEGLVRRFLRAIFRR